MCIFFRCCNSLGRIILSFEETIRLSHRIFIFQRMNRHSQPNAILYLDLQLLKDTYKLPQPDAVKWYAFGCDLKIAPITNRQEGQDEKEPETSRNAFSKTKQLFRKREGSSIVLDNLEKQHIWSDKPLQIRANTVQTPANRFQFDSFGARDQKSNTPVAMLTRNEPEDVDEMKNGWNSGSFEINFGRQYDKEMSLSGCGQSTIENKCQMETDEMLENSIKEFCFKLSQEPYVDLQTTPIKKWSDNKKARKALTEPGHNGGVNKSILKQQMKNCMDLIQNTKEEDITDSIMTDTKELLQNVRGNLTNVKRKLFQGKENCSRDYKEDQSDTKKLFDSRSPVQARRSSQIRQKIFNNTKIDRKLNRKQQPFKV